MLFTLFGTVWLTVGTLALLRSKWLLARIARANRGLYSPGHWQYRVFERTPFGWMQRAMTGRRAEDFVDEASENPSEFPAVIWFIRLLAAFAIVLGAGLIAGGIGDTF